MHCFRSTADVEHEKAWMFVLSSVGVQVVSSGQWGCGKMCGVVFHAVAGMVECVGFIPSFDSSALYLVGVRKFVGPCV